MLECFGEARTGFGAAAGRVSAGLLPRIELKLLDELAAPIPVGSAPQAGKQIDDFQPERFGHRVTAR
jgi:hypothetical protein